MNLINKEYIKIDKLGIFSEILSASDKEDKEKLIFFQKLLHTVMDYKKENKHNTETIYIRISDLKEPEILKISEIPIERQTILNSILYATFNNDTDMIKKLISKTIMKNEVLPNELGDTLDYVLAHSIDMNEYITGENERLIYSDKKNKLEKGYIYNLKENKNYKKLILK